MTWYTLISPHNEQPYSTKACWRLMKFMKGAYLSNFWFRIIHVFPNNLYLSNYILEIMSKSFSCNLCSSTFSVKSSLTKHIDQIHNKIRYSCDLCEKSFTSKQNLKFHIESVHEELKHNCCYCNSIFKLKLSLITHLKSKHTPTVRNNGFPM